VTALKGSDRFLAANLALWDERVAIHRRDETGFYAVERVLAGEDKLNAIEAAEIGDIRGLRVAHLQCHFGLDTICIARRGGDVTGLDFSPAAIAEARKLTAACGVGASFVEGDVYDARALLTGLFDLVYVTWGAINWLPDIGRWAEVVASLLKPGGRLYLAEAHPATLCLDWVDGRIAPRFDWRTEPGNPIIDDSDQTYTGAPDRLVNRRAFEWMHPLGDIITALHASGLMVTRLTEHPAVTWALFPNMVEGDDGLFRLPGGHPQMPLSFSLDAIRR
jgi:SAM-dependent methyltransferase